MKKHLLLLPILGCLVLGGCQVTFGNKNNQNNTTQNATGVTSVIVTGSGKVAVGNTSKYSANVKVSGDVAKTVTWSVSNENIATISSSGVLTAKAAGTVFVTATSTVDSSKKGTITVKLYEDVWSSADQTLMKEHLDNVVLPFFYGTWEWEYYPEEYDEEEDYTYSECVEGFSEDAKYSEVEDVMDSATGWTYLGDDDWGDPLYGYNTTNGVVEVNIYEAEDGVVCDAYFIENQTDWTDEDKVVLNTTIGEEIPFLGGHWEPLEADGSIVYSGSEDVDIDKASLALSTAGYSVDKSESGLSAYKINNSNKKITVELYLDEIYAYFGMDYYDLTISVAQGMNEWPATDIAEAAPQYMDFAIEVVPEVSGSTLYFVSEGYYGLEVECTGGTTPTYAQYIETLKAANWNVNENEEYLEYYGFYICTSPNETIRVLVYLSDILTLEVTSNIPRLNAWPTYVDDYVENTIGSFYSVPALTGGNAYYYEESKIAADEEATTLIDCAVVYIDYNLKAADLEAYYETLLAAGFEGEWIDADDENYASFAVEKGKIGLYAYADDDYEEEYGETELVLMLFNAENEEVPFEVDDVKVLVNGSETIAPTLLAGFTGSFTYASKNTDVATVNNAGVITPVEKGETEITVTFTATSPNTNVYTKDIKVTVLDEATSISIVGEDTVSQKTTSKYKFEFPVGTYKEGEATWSIVEGGSYAEIDAATGVLTAKEVSANQTVTIKCVVAGLEATKQITIASVQEYTFTFGAIIFTEKISESYANCAGKKTVTDPKLGSVSMNFTDVCVQNYKIQFKKTTGVCAGQTAMGQGIVSITLPTDKLSVYVGTSESTCTTKLTGVSSNGNYVYTPTGTFTYFCIKNETSNVVTGIEQISVTYLA